jgi:hypothetical protein
MIRKQVRARKNRTDKSESGLSTGIYPLNFYYGYYR